MNKLWGLCRCTPTSGEVCFLNEPPRLRVSIEARTLLSSTPTAATAPTAWVCVFKSAYEAPTSRHPVITCDRHTGTAIPQSPIPRF